MGMIINGRWSIEDRAMENGLYLRPRTTFRSMKIETDGPGFLVPDRYLLIVSLSCPWCHRITLAHLLKNLENTLPILIAGEPRLEGYSLARGEECSISGINHPVRHLHELYAATAEDYTGRSSIPVLWDTKQGRVVNNESSDILRLLSALPSSDDTASIDLYPAKGQAEINVWNDYIYHGLNNAVYETGFAETQAFYESGVQKVFETLDRLENHLSARSYMVGNTLTETDCRLYPTLVRFDPVYHSHFKCSMRCIADYPALTRYLHSLNDRHGFDATVDLAAIRHGYFFNDRSINPNGIIPRAPITEGETH